MKRISLISSDRYRSIKLVLFSSFMIAVIASYANATPIKYNIMSGDDFFGGPLTGYLFIEDIPSSAHCEEDEEGNFLDGLIVYNIVDFAFNYSGGNITSGENGGGFLELIFTYFDDNIYTLNTANFINSEGNLWHNDMNGVTFTGCERDYWQYLTLPQQILIHDMVPGWSPLFLCGDLVLNRQATPVPEPSTLLLIGSGLFGIATFRKKHRA